VSSDFHNHTCDCLEQWLGDNCKYRKFYSPDPSCHTSAPVLMGSSCFNNTIKSFTRCPNKNGPMVYLARVTCLPSKLCFACINFLFIFSNDFLHLLIDERSGFLFPAALGTLPWQPILGEKSAKLAHHLHSSHWHSKTN